MKTLLLAIIAISLAGCANFDGQKFAQNFGAGMQRQQQPAPTYTPVKVPQTDNQCFQQCMSAGYQFGLCKSKCSY